MYARAFTVLPCTWTFQYRKCHGSEIILGIFCLVTFNTILRLNPTIARTKFSCPILRSADIADTLLLTD